MVGLPDFRFHSKYRPFVTQLLFDHSKSRLILISDPHCITNFSSAFFVDLFLLNRRYKNNWHLNTAEKYARYSNLVNNFRSQKCLCWKNIIETFFVKNLALIGENDRTCIPSCVIRAVRRLSRLALSRSSLPSRSVLSIRMTCINGMQRTPPTSRSWGK